MERKRINSSNFVRRLAGGQSTNGSPGVRKVEWTPSAGSVRLPDKKVKYFLCNGFGFCFWNQKQCAENQGIRSWRREGVGANQRENVITRSWQLRCTHGEAGWLVHLVLKFCWACGRKRQKDKKKEVHNISRSLILKRNLSQVGCG